MPPRLIETLSALQLRADRSEFDRVAELLAPLPSLRDLLSTADRWVDTSVLDGSLIRGWLRELPLDHDVVVSVAWPLDRVATRMTFEQFVDHYDDLWYPAQDELLVLSEAAEHSCLVVLDHEERFSFSALDPAGPSTQRTEWGITLRGQHLPPER